MQRLAPCKGEQLARQFSAMRDTRHGVAAQRLGGGAVARIGLHQFEIALDDPQDIVEIVRDPAGELAD